MKSREGNPESGLECTVLLVAHLGDEHADQLASVLRDRGQAALIRESRDRLPGSMFTWTPDGGLIVGVDDIGGSIGMSGLWRRPSWPTVDGYAADSQSFAFDECVDAFDGAIGSLHVRWITPPHVLRRAELKLYQLGTARSAGLRIPHTVVTNNPQRAVEFATRIQRAVVKPVRYGLVGADACLVAWTSEVSVTELSELNGPPVILQERLDAALHLRAVTVGDRVFVATLETDATDWRVELENHNRFKRAAPRLAAKVAQGARTMAGALSVGFSAQDWILAQDGQLYFLEANPNGQWLFLDELWDGEITSAIAEMLESLAMSEGRAA